MCASALQRVGERVRPPAARGAPGRSILPGRRRPDASPTQAAAVPLDGSASRSLRAVTTPRADRWPSPGVLLDGRQGGPVLTVARIVQSCRTMLACAAPTHLRSGYRGVGRRSDRRGVRARGGQRLRPGAAPLGRGRVGGPSSLGARPTGRCPPSSKATTSRHGRTSPRPRDAHDISPRSPCTPTRVGVASRFTHPLGWRARTRRWRGSLVRPGKGHLLAAEERGLPQAGPVDPPGRRHSGEDLGREEQEGRPALARSSPSAGTWLAAARHPEGRVARGGGLTQSPCTLHRPSAPWRGRSRGRATPSLTGAQSSRRLRTSSASTNAALRWADRRDGPLAAVRRPVRSRSRRRRPQSARPDAACGTQRLQRAVRPCHPPVQAPASPGLERPPPLPSSAKAWVERPLRLVLWGRRRSRRRRSRPEEGTSQSGIGPPSRSGAKASASAPWRLRLPRRS